MEDEAGSGVTSCSMWTRENTSEITDTASEALGNMSMQVRVPGMAAAAGGWDWYLQITVVYMMMTFCHMSLPTQSRQRNTGISHKVRRCIQL